jgi:hypothetical protein
MLLPLEFRCGWRSLSSQRTGVDVFKLSPTYKALPAERCFRSPPCRRWYSGSQWQKVVIAAVVVTTTGLYPRAAFDMAKELLTVGGRNKIYRAYILWVAVSQPLRFQLRAD